MISGAMKYGVPTTVDAKSGVSRLSPKSPICARDGQESVGKTSHRAEYWQVARKKNILWFVQSNGSNIPALFLM